MTADEAIAIGRSRGMEEAAQILISLARTTTAGKCNRFDRHTSEALAKIARSILALKDKS